MYLSSDLAGIGYRLHIVFFAFDIICLTYLVNSFADYIVPGFAAQLVPWIQLPALIGEGSLCLWLLVVGVNVERWEERADVALRVRATRRQALT